MQVHPDLRNILEDVRAFATKFLQGKQGQSAQSHASVLFLNISTVDDFLTP